MIVIFTPLSFEAAGAKVNNLDSRASLLPQQNIFRLHVAMNNVLIEHDPHALKYRISESSYQMNTKTLVVIFFDQLIQIYT